MQIGMIPLGERKASRKLENRKIQAVHDTEKIHEKIMRLRNNNKVNRLPGFRLCLTGFMALESPLLLARLTPTLTLRFNGVFPDPIF